MPKEQVTVKLVTVNHS